MLLPHKVLAVESYAVRSVRDLEKSFLLSPGVLFKQRSCSNCSTFPYALESNIPES